MNENIKKLIVKAGGIEDIDPVFHSQVVFYRPDMENMAKLMIEEIENLLAITFYSDPHHVYEFVDDIKEHFGMKE